MGDAKADFPTIESLKQAHHAFYVAMQRWFDDPENDELFKEAERLRDASDALHDKASQAVRRVLKL